MFKITQTGLVICRGGQSKAVSSLDFICKKTGLLTLLLAGASFAMNLINTELTEKKCCSLSQIIDIGSGIVKMWTVKQSGLDFLGRPVFQNHIHHIVSSG